MQDVIYILRTLKTAMELREARMNGDGQSHDSRSPDGNDYNELHADVTSAIEEIAEGLGEAF